MASIRIEGLPVAQPEPDPWPMDDHPLSVQADEMFARQLDTEFAGEVREIRYGEPVCRTILPTGAAWLGVSSHCFVEIQTSLEALSRSDQVGRRSISI